MGEEFEERMVAARDMFLEPLLQKHEKEMHSTLKLKETRKVWDMHNGLMRDAFDLGYMIASGLEAFE